MENVLYNRLLELGQEHVLEQFNKTKSTTLLKELHDIDYTLLEQSIALFNKKLPSLQEVITPVNTPKDPDLFFNQGEEYFKEHPVAVLVFAGGEASRLGSSTVKGATPLFSNTTLFSLLCDKAKKHKNRYGIEPFIAIMTSKTTDAATRTFFKENHYFGLSEDHIDFFMQGSLPVLSQTAKLYITIDQKILKSPDGNGKAFWHFVHSGIPSKWEKNNVKITSIMQIDNPMLYPFLEELYGAYIQEKKDAIAIAIKRIEPSEKVGIFVHKKGKLAVIEYSEIENISHKERLSDLELFPFANISSFIVSLRYIMELTRMPCTLPLHIAVKEMTDLQMHKTGVNIRERVAKFEYFIFDMLPLGSSSLILLPRETSFFPIKTKEDIILLKNTLKEYFV